MKPITFYEEVDVTSREAMISFLTNHFRYHTMNSWNGSTSYANNLKIHRVIPHELMNQVWEMYDCEDFYYPINDLLSDFDIDHDYRYQVGFNGRSSGYLVLYTGGKENGKVHTYPGRSIDQDEDFEEWETEDLKARVELVQEFDHLCDEIVDLVINMCNTCKVEIETYTEIKERKIITCAG